MMFEKPVEGIVKVVGERMVMDDDSDLGSVLESSRGMDGSDEDGSAGGSAREET
ncbi:hypothetical protein LLJ07_03245 [Bifidobacterium bifidum]|uniref:hypothetical protein n=1 Tax=Bifidobacterium bifidum TaxID=1681 RepID=UPI0012DA65D3|nr:hypothetical protein [Bifidobacterium bifidum]MBH8617279.1 hypothetical protein [Bifidobacterium bifidum]MCC3150050.1 hypothetical protein [Bifidobacterium bifidum]MCC8305856.1 hypothetical protein [Bifidobacterium bifidum]MCG2833538.1 hypothetical protein [Bifidobacterium bifidum]